MTQQDNFNKIRFFPDVLDKAGSDTGALEVTVNVMEVYNHGLALFAAYQGFDVPTQAVEIKDLDENTGESYMRLMRVCSCLMRGLIFQEENIGNTRELEALKGMREHDAFEHAANYGFFVGLAAGIQMSEPKYNKPDGEFEKGEIDPHFVNFMLDTEVLGSRIMEVRSLTQGNVQRKSILEVEAQKAACRKLIRNLNGQLKDLYKYFEIDPGQN
jgi:hypothetical protein